MSPELLFSRDVYVLSFPETVDSFVFDVPITFQQLQIKKLSSKTWTLPGHSTLLTKQPWFIIWPV